MSKGYSGLFHGTIDNKTDLSTALNPVDIIRERTKQLDLHEHPRKKHLTAKQRKEILSKIANRTATKEDYKLYDSDKRFAERRKTGITEFWKQERQRIKNNEATTRNWSNEQKYAILHGERPQYNGKTIQGHHTYNASNYPHLANRGEIIYPVTFDEHFYGWHGGNFNNSLPGIPVKKVKYKF